MITLKSLPKRFTLNTGSEWAEVEQIGRGRFCTAYRDISSTDVYLVVKEEIGDYSKRILGDCSGPYFPKLEYLGPYSSCEVFKTTYYRKLTAKSKQAWKEFRACQKARDEAWSQTLNQYRQQSVSQLGQVCIGKTLDILRDAGSVSEELLEALEELASAAGNYGSGYTFEFAARNLAVDENDHLILLDPVFDLETTERDRITALKRRQGRYV